MHICDQDKPEAYPINIVALTDEVKTNKIWGGSSQAVLRATTKVEEGLTTSLSNSVSMQALAPLKSLIANEVTEVNIRLEDLQAYVRQRLHDISDFARQVNRQVDWHSKINQLQHACTPKRFVQHHLHKRWIWFPK